MRRAVRDFRVVVDGSEMQPDARSGAGVWAARTAAGDAAYLKVTPAGQGPEALSAARREFRFYEELSGGVPVRTPRVLDGVNDRAGVALLLGAAGEARSPALWTVGMWAELGSELAALHSMPLPPGPQWTRSDAAMRALADPDVDRVNAFWAGTLPRLADVVADRSGLRDAITALAPVFTHGDCHTGNLLHSAGSLVFCDWQAAGIGRPASDLAFVTVRATPSGAVVPSALLEAYLSNRPCDRRILERAIIAEELAAFVFLWPPYAAFNSPSGIARVVRRTRELARRWFAR
jgi:aminoglycoside phosphotransferase (APT) family kinase protein